eukprot:GHVL01043686.1.p1 GENE.GHVL01043686.1~~GHVL01043686.1.p1  ORF type:complete len:535 (+),score=118.45 GHVL01043686.1:51-1655(+)
MAKKQKSAGINRTQKSSKAQICPAFRKGNSSSNPFRKLPDGKSPGFYRDKSTIQRLEMYRSKPKDISIRRKQPLKPARIHPDRRWFGNVRQTTAEKLSFFREKMMEKTNDAYSVVLKRSKLPMSLIVDKTTASPMDLLTVESFSEVFGKKSTRKRPKVSTEDFNSLLETAETAQCKYLEVDDKSIPIEDTGIRPLVSEEIFKKGTSKRIWQELYKVVDSADVIIFVIDARDPLGTRCTYLEKKIKKDHPNKHIVLLLNKVDLVPTWSSSKWVEHLGKELPTVAFHAHIQHSFGKMSLINLLRQFAQLRKDRKHLCIGFLGYPNVGKSSVINTLRGKKVCIAAPVPGQTKVWQYVNLTNKIFLIDCPGVVPGDSPDKTPETLTFAEEASKVLKGIVRAERLSTPSDYISFILERVQRKHLLKRFNLTDDFEWLDSEDFLAKLAILHGKLFKKGVPDLETMAKKVINDWQRGKLPYFIPPPGCEGRNDLEESNEKEEEKKVEITEKTEEEKTKKTEESKNKKNNKRKKSLRNILKY